MKNGFRVIDSELHLEEPPNLWEKRLPERYRSRMRIIMPAAGHAQAAGKRYEFDGRILGDTAAFSTLVQKQSLSRVSGDPHLIKARTACAPDVYLEGLDIEGIDVAVLMPTIMLAMATKDDLAPDLALAVCRAYNDWAYEFSQADPLRFKFWGWLPRQDGDLAAEEARRCLEQLGAAGVAMPFLAVNGNLLSDPCFDPLWRELDRLEAPLGLHPASSALTGDLRLRYLGHPRSQLTARVAYEASCVMSCVAELTLGAVLDRFPRMRCVIMESQVAWLPWLLSRLDHLWEMFGPFEDYALALSPSDYFRRQCCAVVDCDEDLATFMIDYGMEDNLLISTDYPHHDSPFPNGISGFLAMPGLSDGCKRKILWDNGARLIGLAERAHG
jgi:uncharacterized protein